MATKGNRFMSNATLAEVIDRHGVDVLDHLDRQLEVPVLAGLQAQGDVIVVPEAIGYVRKPATTPVPRAGVAVVQGENGGNTHLLIAEGEVFFDSMTRTDTGLDLGVLTVAEGAQAFLAHPEHGYAGIAPGSYTVRRQREQADEIRLVQD